MEIHDSRPVDYRWHIVMMMVTYNVCLGVREECKVMISSLKEEDGSIITNRERILERCAEFCEKLYEDTVQNIAKVETEEVPSILTSELERALSQMKSSKTPAEDQIVAEMIKAGDEIALRKISELFNAVLRTETVPKE